MNSDIDTVTDKDRVRPEKSEVYRLRCDNSKIKAMTGFEPGFSLEQGLSQTIEWFRDPVNSAKYKWEIYNV